MVWKKLLLLAGVLVIVSGLIACAPKPVIEDAVPPKVGVLVTGEGKVMAVPDVAIFSLGVEAEAKTVAEAQRQADEAMNKVMKALTVNGVAEKDIQTQRLSIYPIRRWIEKERREEIIGYRVTNNVTAKIRKIDKAGAIIDAVVEAGGDFIRIQGINFTIDDPTPYLREAREKAVKEGVAKAKQVAEVAGIKLGKLIYISEVAVYIPRVPLKLVPEILVPEIPPPPAPPILISPGELEIRITVQMVYKIG